MLQAVLQSPFSNGGGSPSQESLGDSRFTYVPAVSVAGGDVVQADLATPATTIGQVAAPPGELATGMRNESHSGLG